jgi:hypothetical protein
MVGFDWIVVVMEELNSYLKKNGARESLLTPNVQMCGVELVTKQKRIPLMKLVAKLYRISEIEQLVVQLIKDHSRNGNYKEVRNDEFYA